MSAGNEDKDFFVLQDIGSELAELEAKMCIRDRYNIVGIVFQEIGEFVSQPEVKPEIGDQQQQEETSCNNGESF